MNRKSSNYLTLLIGLILITSISHSAIFTEQKLKTHLRWNLFIPKDQVRITKDAGKVKIETLNLSIYEDLVKDLSVLKLRKSYFKKINNNLGNFPEEAAKIEINLKNDMVELFTFYKNDEKKYVLDFWKEPKNYKSSPKKSIASRKAVKKIVKPVVNKNLGVKNKVKKLIIKKSIKRKKYNDDYRDFRYGASIVFDYPPLLPSIDIKINLESKTADYFYPIKDREYEKSDKEAHMQLSINLYRREKWGLMAKSIRLYTKKYNEDDNYDLNEFLKANSLLKKNLTDKNMSVVKTALVRLENLINLTKKNELKYAILKYLIQYNVHEGNRITALELAKKLYVHSRENFDIETSVYAAEVILNSLARLDQVKKMIAFINEGNIKTLLPRQLSIAYLTYTYLKLQRHNDVIKLFKKESVVFQKPLHSSILFNVAEAYFRLSKYTKATKFFDEFLVDYSHFGHASHARGRIALSYDILDKDIKVVKALYKEAINKSSNAKIRYENKIRYVGVVFNRKKVKTALDSESIVFLNNTPEEKKTIDKDIKKILWLVRLRTLITSNKLEEALVYLNTVPLSSLIPMERRVFEGDGAEIVYGLILKYFSNSDYGKIITLWNVYKDVYVDKVALDPYVNYIVSKSYLRLGLHESFGKSIKFLTENVSSPQRFFPNWFPRKKRLAISEYLDELILLKLINEKQWKKASVKIDMMVFAKRSAQKNYYKGIVFYKLKKYVEAVTQFEKFIVLRARAKDLSQEEMAYFSDYYSDSLYNINKKQRFKKVSYALLNDIDAIKNENMSVLLLESKKRIRYLLIEVLISENKKENFVELEPMIAKFRNDYPKSQYDNRVTYLFGLSLLRNKKEKESIKVLNDLVNDVKVIGYIRELARSELSTIRINKDQI